MMIPNTSLVELMYWLYKLTRWYFPGNESHIQTTSYCFTLFPEDLARDSCQQMPEIPINKSPNRIMASTHLAMRGSKTNAEASIPGKLIVLEGRWLRWLEGHDVWCAKWCFGMVHLGMVPKIRHPKPSTPKIRPKLSASSWSHKPQLRRTPSRAFHLPRGGTKVPRCKLPYPGKDHISHLGKFRKSSTETCLGCRHIYQTYISSKKEGVFWRFFWTRTLMSHSYTIPSLENLDLLVRFLEKAPKRFSQTVVSLMVMNPIGTIRKRSP